METITELKDICKKPGNTPVKRFYRKISYYFTWFLLHFKLTANQVSVLGFVLGLFSAVLFITNNDLMFVFASLLFFLSMMADYCDGEVMRYRKYKKLPDELWREHGGFFDWMNHIARPLIFLCMSISFINLPYNPYLILGIGFISGFLCFYDTGIHALFSGIFKIKNVYKKNKLARKIRYTFYSPLVTPFLLLSSSIIDVFFEIRATFYLWLLFALCGVLLFFLESVVGGTRE